MDHLDSADAISPVQTAGFYIIFFLKQKDIIIILLTVRAMNWYAWKGHPKEKQLLKQL